MHITTLYGVTDDDDDDDDDDDTAEMTIYILLQCH